MTRTIMIFPEFDNMDIINNIRMKYDPLAALVQPHITLVFPFDSDLTNEELRLHLKKTLQGLCSFKIVLEGFRKQQDRFGNYIFLNVVQGMDEMKDIHDMLYTDKLKQYDAKYDYIPHITVGKLSSAELLEEAYEDVTTCNAQFSTMVKRISVEMIGEHEESIIIIEHELN